MLTNLAFSMETFKNCRILCVGDIMLDRYVSGRVERISPEAPVAVVHMEREEDTLGAVGNVVKNIASLGGQVEVISVIGDDVEGHCIKQMVLSLPAAMAKLIKETARPTTVKTRYVGGGQHLLRVDRESKAPIKQQTEKPILRHLRRAMRLCDVVVVSDYAKGVLTDNIIREVMALAKKYQKRVLVDPKGKSFSRYRGAHLLTPNHMELTLASGMLTQTHKQVEDAARSQIFQHDLGGVLAKLGPDGVLLVMKDQIARHYPSTKPIVQDVSGAGDTVIATLALALANGMDIENAAALSNLAGAVAVTKKGTSSVSCTDLAREIQYQPLTIADRKVHALQKVPEIVEVWRKQGLRIGLTYGSYNPIQSEHLAIFHQARSHCDRLIVGIYSDAHLHRSVAHDKLAQDESTRTEVLASLSNIDSVVIHDNPISLIEEIKPDVFIYNSAHTINASILASIQGSCGHVVSLDIESRLAASSSSIHRSRTPCVRPANLSTIQMSSSTTLCAGGK